MWDLSIYASITEHDKWRRYEFLRQLRDLGVDPEESGDRLEIRFTGNRETVLRLSAVCESCRIHDIRISRWED